MASIDITGLDEIMRRSGYQRDLNLDGPMRKSMAILHEAIADYPPQRPSSYRRTGTLGRGWTTAIERRLRGIAGRVGNNVHYAPQVQGAETQRALFRNYWQTNEDVIEEHEREVRQIFRNYVLDQLR